MRSVLFSLLMLSSTAQAADWLAIQGTEPDDPDKSRLRAAGFVQISAEAFLARPVEGLTGDLEPYNGQIAAFNKVPGADGTAKITLRRVRAGFRGVIPETDGRISTNVAVELGQNPLTTSADGWRPRLMDASVTLAGPAGTALRVGQFKLPLADESLEAFHLTTDLVRFSPVAGRLLMERDTVGGRINGFRDVGAQAFGSHLVQKTEVSWAGMVSNGTVELGRVEPGVDLTGRVQVARLFDSPRRSPFRDELAAYAWATSGMRRVDEDTTFRRTRAGGGLQLRHSGVRARTELVVADGMIDLGVSPPFKGGTRVTAGEGTAWGLTGLVSKRFAGTWEVGLAGSHLDSMPKGGAQRRIFDDVTWFGQYHVSKHAWFDLNLAWRTGRAPDGSDNVDRILDTMGPYGAVMVTVVR